MNDLSDYYAERLRKYLETAKESPQLDKIKTKQKAYVARKDYGDEEIECTTYQQ